MIRTDDELITKKQLLEKTGISYGQLYRWKRKKLIPESWFIRKATYTGQETFFPKEKILNRVDQITALKDKLSLDELADRFSPLTMKRVTLSADEAVARHIVSASSVSYFLKAGHDGRSLHFPQLLALSVLDLLLSDGRMNAGESEELLQVLSTHGPDHFDRNSCLYFIRKMGVPAFFIVLDDTELYFDRKTHIVAQLQLQPYAEKLAAKLNGSIHKEDLPDV
ncbi:DUF4004 family protein [Sporolactobacillus vineae]|uniref:DUF4004 family protein n=1 Tax=Sporolactobacillus vineae TaxID=444463 RepID=UPI00028A26BF|nr:DUF4004 family protein [Sporolactobacillus vineae]